MIVQRASSARGDVSAGWLKSQHTFSFGHYYDPEWMGFGPLRVINEDRVAPRGGFPPHRHANMEILSYVLSGALAHRDDTGSEGVLRPGELQWMSAGHGIEHSEFNASESEPVHFLQIWIQPDRLNAAPGYEQRAFDPEARRGRWATLASPDGADGSLAIRQQAFLRGVRLGDGESVDLVLDPARRYWLHVAQGGAVLDGRALSAGDALGLVDEGGTRSLSGRGAEIADVLLFDLPA
ncbi:quercetin 2,3-dioxygenase [Lysobacter caseinilyticus]|uniref:Quercetin 2,3-dioxygenase n=1 Tax=Noviluteimonas caseinilytica TaxID=2675101 RepID=A0ABN6FSL6_9GAMM|nr:MULTISPECIES: pirin family protein [Lysobacter]BCT92643.1 quercetin 2,3-dioxygenase [Lysobacter caseinilyticus]